MMATIAVAVQQPGGPPEKSDADRPGFSIQE